MCQCIHLITHTFWFNLNFYHISIDTWLSKKKQCKLITHVYRKQLAGENKFWLEKYGRESGKEVTKKALKLAIGNFEQAKLEKKLENFPIVPNYLYSSSVLFSTSNA